MKFEFSKDNVLNIWTRDDLEAPDVIQPTWPNGTPWASKAEATAWAKAHIKSYEDETAPWAGSGPDEPTIERTAPVSSVE